MSHKLDEPTAWNDLVEIGQSERHVNTIESTYRGLASTVQENNLEVVPYDPGWPAAFEAEAMRLRTALGPLALRIDHNGSTSIPGLGAKPIIDIQVSVATLQPIAAYGERLQAIGYVHMR